MENAKSGWLAKVLLAFFACMAVLAAGMQRTILPWVESFTQDALRYIIIFCAVLVLGHSTLWQHEKRTGRYALVLAVLFALVEALGYSLNQYNSLEGIYANGGQVLKHAVFMLGAGFVLYCLFGWLLRSVCTDAVAGRLIVQAPSHSMRRFLVYWLIIFVLWVPYLLAYFPGAVNLDANDQIKQALELRPLLNHHPVAHTLVIRLCLWVGSLLGRDGNGAGIAVYSILQMALMSATFAFALWYLEKRRLPRWCGYVVLAYYALLPVHAIFSIGMWKDVPFSCFVLIYTIVLFDLVGGKDGVLTRRMRIPLYTASALGMLLFRNNGLHVLLLTVPFLLVFLRSSRKLLLLLTCIVLAVFAVYRGPAFRLLDVQEGPSREALSIPLQQLARTVRQHGGELDAEDKDIIGQLLPVESGSIGDVYDPRSADPVKNRMDEAYFAENRPQVAGVWAKLLARHPLTYVESFLANSFGYWYPDTQYWVASTLMAEEGIDVERTSRLPGFARFVKEHSLENMSGFPLAAPFYSVGFSFLAFLLCGAVMLYKRRARQLLALLPAFWLWMTCLASPIYAEFRYLYGLTMALPVIIPLTLQQRMEAPTKQKAKKPRKAEMPMEPTRSAELSEVPKV